MIFTKLLYCIFDWNKNDVAGAMKICRFIHCGLALFTNATAVSPKYAAQALYFLAAVARRRCLLSNGTTDFGSFRPVKNWWCLEDPLVYTVSIGKSNTGVPPKPNMSSVHVYVADSFDFKLWTPFPLSACAFIKMEGFWNQIAIDLQKKSIFHCGKHDCIEWSGAREHGIYGKKSVLWPDGSKTMERTHRLSYMLFRKLLREEMPHFNQNGERLDVSHICHNGICLRVEHLVLEPHSTNMERMGCKMRNICTHAHYPYCLL